MSWNVLPELLEQPAALPLKRWLDGREGGGQRQALSRDRWQLARMIADAFDDYALYRADQLAQWSTPSSSAETDWQPLLWRRLADQLDRPPFGLQVREAIDRLRRGVVSADSLPCPIAFVRNQCPCPRASGSDPSPLGCS